MRPGTLTLMPVRYRTCLTTRYYLAPKKHVQLCLQRFKSDLTSISDSRRSSAFEPVTTSESITRAAHLNPPPDEYSRTAFVDKCSLAVHAGSGGNGCVSFFRDVHIPDGPPNGGDGGSGGNVWIQAVSGHTSLHKIARRGIVKAGRGIGGQGKSQNGRRGEDICIVVPVGTVVREVWRSDPLAEDEARWQALKASAIDGSEQDSQDQPNDKAWTRNKWIIYPGAQGNQLIGVNESLPSAPKPRRTQLSVLEPRSPIQLDLDKPMEKPILLAAGAAGGLGNPHFATKALLKPKFASKGELGVRIKLELELKLLADVGLVGMPNAGKSTLLRSISNSRTRVGDWQFTTLEPTVGTVVLDTNIGRPLVRAGLHGQPPRHNFTVADIPGLIEDAHLDKGLGLGFLRHVERARMLAFVIDLSEGDAVKALKKLWREVGEYENLRNQEIAEDTQSRMVDWSSFAASVDSKGSDSNPNMTIFPEPSRPLEPLKMPPISSKPWYVIATKADKVATPDEFAKLKSYVASVESGLLPHPSGKKNGWRDRIATIPVSAINDEGTSKIAEWTAGLLDSLQGASFSSNASLTPPRDDH